MLKSVWIAGLAGVIAGSALTIGLQQTTSVLNTKTPRPERHKDPVWGKVNISKEPSIGSENAPLTIVEFSDFECPYCKRFHDETFPALKREFIDTGLVRFIHKHLPLPFHENALAAAKAAYCSQEQDKYWNTYHALFNQQDCLKCKGPLEIAKNSGLKATQLESCTTRKKTATAIQISISEAALNGIRSTPTFIIGPSTNQYHEGRVVTGALHWSEFKKIVRQELLKQQSSQRRGLKRATDA